MTWREFVLRLRAYERMESSSWNKVRLLAWKTIEPHIDHEKLNGFSVYEWFPIIGDPTPAEIRVMSEQRKKGQAEEAQKIYYERLEAMRSAGFDV